MAIFSRMALVAGCLLVSGCAIRPMPEDVTGLPTHIIVQQIRCETRQAIIDSAVGWLTNPENLAEGRVDPASAAIGLEFASGQRRIQDFRPELFRARVAQLVKLFFDTGVAYNFDLQMSEVNNLNTEINLLKPFPPSKLTVGIKGGFDRLRKNERQFTITDTFKGLVQLPDNYCRGEGYNYVAESNYVYPIAGRIGVVRLVQDFIQMTLFSNLGGPKDKPKGPPTLVDTLAFQTLITGTLTPKVVFAPVGTGLSVTDAALTGVSSRTDLHTLTMGLAIAGPGIKLVSPIRTTLFTAPLLTAHPVTSAEANAAEAVSQALTLRLFKPTINVVAP